MPRLLTVFAGATALVVSAFALTQGQKPDSPSGSIADNGKPVLVELFTSQGCSSCPPADALVARIKHESGMVIISRPVTYWDRLGWKDTLAREENTQLQRLYAHRGLSGQNGIYTPQMVANGRIGFVGSSEKDLRKAVLQARGQSTAAIVTRALPKGDWLVGLGGTAPKGAELMLVAVSNHVTVAIGRGENGGRDIGYTNVLRAETRIARWAGGRKSVNVPAARLKTPGADRYALILREANGGPVLASAWIG